jgi:hypothetical protein
MHLAPPGQGNVTDIGRAGSIAPSRDFAKEEINRRFHSVEKQEGARRFMVSF